MKKRFIVMALMSIVFTNVAVLWDGKYEDISVIQAQRKLRWHQKRLDAWKFYKCIITEQEKDFTLWKTDRKNEEVLTECCIALRDEIIINQQFESTDIAERCLCETPIDDSRTFFGIFDCFWYHELITTTQNVSHVWSTKRSAWKSRDKYFNRPSSDLRDAPDLNYERIGKEALIKGKYIKYYQEVVCASNGSMIVCVVPDLDKIYVLKPTGAVRMDVPSKSHDIFIKFK